MDDSKESSRAPRAADEVLLGQCRDIIKQHCQTQVRVSIHSVRCHYPLSLQGLVRRLLSCCCSFPYCSKTTLAHSATKGGWYFYQALIFMLNVFSFVSQFWFNGSENGFILQLAHCIVKSHSRLRGVQESNQTAVR